MTSRVGIKEIQNGRKAPSQLGTLDSNLELREEVICFQPQRAPLCDEGDLGILRLVAMQVDQKGEHGDVAGNGEDIDGRGGFLADVDLLVGDVVAAGEGLRDMS